MILIEMAANRSKAMDECRSEMKVIQEHIIKCVLYSHRFFTVRHWINNELTPAVWGIGNIKVKTPSGKLSENDYKQIFNEVFDEDIGDAYMHLHHFYVMNMKSKEYPIKQPADDDARKLFHIYEYFRNNLVKKFATERDIDKTVINKILWEILA